MIKFLYMKTSSRNSPATSHRASKAGSSYNSSRGSSRYASPGKDLSPSRFVSPSHSITFQELASKAINDLLKVRAKKISKTIEIVAKEHYIHKKLKSFLSDELKSKKSATQQFSMKKVDERVSFIMKESASELLELENKCKLLSDQNKTLKKSLDKGQNSSTLYEHIESIARSSELIELDRDPSYINKIQKTAEELVSKWEGLGMNQAAAGLAWNLMQEKNLYIKVRKENSEVLQYERKIRKGLEEKLRKFQEFNES